MGLCVRVGRRVALGRGVAAKLVHDARGIHGRHVRGWVLSQAGGQAARAECQVGRVHSGRVNAEANLTRSGLGFREIHDREDIGVPNSVSPIAFIARSSILSLFRPRTG
jgi:hypothetical protein